MKEQLLRSVIAERVSADESSPESGWTVGSCRHCDTKVWLSNAWVEVLADDPSAMASCFECAHALVGHRK